MVGGSLCAAWDPWGMVDPCRKRPCLCSVCTQGDSTRLRPVLAPDGQAFHHPGSTGAAFLLMPEGASNVCEPCWGWPCPQAFLQPCSSSVPKHSQVEMLQIPPAAVDSSQNTAGMFELQ